jgi:hypothetical protein
VIHGACHCGTVQWRSQKVPESATACSCTACRRYGALWAYGRENEDVSVSGGPTSTYTKGRWVMFHFCSACGCMAYWRALKPDTEGRFQMGVNLRLSDPEVVAEIPVVRHDGVTSDIDLPKDGRCVADYWF